MKLVKIIGYTFLSVLVLAVCIRFGMSIYLNSNFKALLNSNPHRHYNVEYDHLEVNLIQGDLKLIELSVEPRKAVFDSLLHIQKNPAIMVDLNVDEVIFEGFHYFAYLRKKLLVKQIAINDPKLSVHILPKPIKNTADTAQSTHSNSVFEEFKIEHFSLENASAQLYSIVQGDTLNYGTVKDMDYTFDYASYNPKDESKPYTVENMWLDIDSIQLNQLGAYEASIQKIGLDFKKEEAYIINSTLTPRLSISEFDNKLDYRKPRMRYSIDSLWCSHIDFEKAIYLEWDARILEFFGLDVEMYVNNKLPQAPNKNFDLVATKFREVKGFINIDSIQINNSSFTYLMPGAQKEGLAQLNFSKINGYITNCNNQTAVSETPKLMVTSITCEPHKTGHLQVLWQIDLADANDSFTSRIIYKDADLTAFNNIIEKTTHIHINEGQLPFLDLRITGNSKTIEGEILYELEQLSLQINKVKDNEKKERKFTSFIANSVIPGDTKEPKMYHSQFEFPMPPKTTYLKLQWVSLQEGLKNGFLHNDYKKLMKEEKHSAKKADRKRKKAEKKERRKNRSLFQ